MLPAPVSFTTRRKTFRRNVVIPRRRTVDILLTRARVTNLAVVLLVFFAALSFVCNLFYFFTSPTLHYGHDHRPSSILATISRDRAVKDLRNLIIVPGHAIWKGTESDLRLDEDNWVLEPYQKGGTRVSTFFRHVAHSTELALNDPTALVIFSGGQTRSDAATTEAESYMRLALSFNLFKTTPPHSPFLRATTEDHALDSFQNLLFSIARFREFTGHFPHRITVVGYEMKRSRFIDLHRKAVRWPLERFEYIGIDMEGGESVAATEGEKRNGYIPFSMDSYGCHSELLSKRVKRNPYARYHPYHSSSPELTGLLDWCPGPEEGGPTTLFQGSLPWD